MAARVIPDQETGTMRPYVRYLVFILTIMNVLNCMDRIAMSVLLPQIKVDLHLSDAQLGLLVGLAFSLFYATCGIPIARLADRGNRARVMVWSLTVWSLMTAASGMAQNFVQLMLSRMGLALGFGPLCIGVASDLLTPRFGSEALRYALQLPLLLYPLFVWSLLATAKDLAQDLANAELPQAAVPQEVHHA